MPDVPPEVEEEFADQLDAYMEEWEESLRRKLTGDGESGESGD